MAPSQACPPHPQPTWLSGPQPGLGGLLWGTETCAPGVSVPSERADRPCMGVWEWAVTPQLPKALGADSHPSLLYLQGEAGISGLPGGLGLRGPPVSGCPDLPHYWEQAPCLPRPPNSTTRGFPPSTLPFLPPPPAPFPFVMKAVADIQGLGQARPQDTDPRTGRGAVDRAGSSPPKTQSREASLWK